MSRRPKIIVLGNEKGGSGKSTTAMHVCIALLKRGYSVGSMDLDARQGTFSRAMENRKSFAKSSGLKLLVPQHWRIFASEAPNRADAEAENEAKLKTALGSLWSMDFLVIDTPGSDNFLARLGHSYADILITPMNDSFLDLDILGRFDPEGETILSPSIYSQMVWEQRQQRAVRGMPPIDWVVMRNRLSHIDARNKRDIGRLLGVLAKRIGFRLAPGFGERVIFRELFPMGLTLLDLREQGMEMRISMSHLAARQELRDLLATIGLADIEEEEEDHPILATGAA